MAGSEAPLLLLDLDNTLWDFDANAEEALSELFYRHHLHLRTDYSVAYFVEVYKVTNKAFWKRYELGEINKEYLRSARFTDTFLQMGIPESEHPEQIWEEYLSICPNMTRLMPGATLFLEEMSELFRIGLITNGFENTQTIKLKQSGIGRFTSFMVTSESLGVAKPAAEIFLHACAIGGVAPAETCYAGDTWTTDVFGAANAGIPAIWYNHAGTEQSEKVANPGLFLGEARSLIQVAGIIRTHFGI